jgi:hypothetical protein
MLIPSEVGTMKMLGPVFKALAGWSFQLPTSELDINEDSEWEEDEGSSQEDGEGEAQ